MKDQVLAINNHTIVLANGKYVVTHPDRGVVTRIPRGVGAKRRAVNFARAQRA